MKRVGTFWITMATLIALTFGLTSRLVASEASADSNAPTRLQEYLRLAALNNAGLKAAFEEWKAATEQVPQARALPDPQFTYGYFIREVETRVGPQKNRLGIMQVFPWLGVIEARTDAAAAAAKAAHGRYEAKKLSLFYEAKDAFYEYAYLARAVEIAKENLELVRHFEEVARTKYIAVTASQPDVIRAQIELAKVEDQLRTLEDFRKPIAARLNAVLNRQSFAMLPWPSRGEFQEAQISRDRVLALLRAGNPELQSLQLEAAAAKSRVELARKKFYPNVGVGVDWIQTDDALMPGTRDSGKDPVILMFSMNLPLWRKSYRAAELQAEANLRRARQRTTETENTLIAHAERALYGFDDSARKIKLYGNILVPKAEELLRVSETAYKGGTLDFLSLIDAQRKFLEYELNRERAVTDNLQSLAELEMLAGSELTAAAKDAEGM